MANFDLVNLALKSTCPGNEIILDDKGLPSVMVYVPKFKVSDVITGGSDSTHPAFIVNGTEIDGIYISKYQNVVHNGRAYSLPCEDPKASVNFDTAKSYCEAKGAGWHLMTNAEWAAIALWCRKNGTMPKGNNNYGKDSAETLYTAIPSYYESNKIARVATGTGPVSWSHNGEISGIWDLNGNVNEWNGGYRTVDGEIQITPNNDASAQINQSATSTLWKAIMPDGSLVAPGTAGTLKWDYVSGTPASGTGQYGFQLNTTLSNPVDNDTAYGYKTFETISTASGVTVPEILKSLSLYPADSESHGADGFYMRNRGERLGSRGGGWNLTSDAGVFCMNGSNPRSSVGAGLGFRSAFVKL